MAECCSEFFSSVCFFLFYFFFLIIRRPPISTLFPYTTLFRSMLVSSGFRYFTQRVAQDCGFEAEQHIRSEEHTSELQSRFGISYAVFFLKLMSTIGRAADIRFSRLCRQAERQESLVCIFFLMFRRPPSSTPFPKSALFP